MIASKLQFATEGIKYYFNAQKVNFLKIKDKGEELLLSRSKNAARFVPDSLTKVLKFGTCMHATYATRKIIVIISDFSTCKYWT